MSKKAELIKLFQEFKDRYVTVQTKVTEISQSDAYTQIGKEETIKRTLEEFKPTIQLYHDKAIAAIDNGLTALMEKWKSNSAGRLKDAGYQIGLGNVIKMIESGAIHDKDDMENIIDTYKDDYNAIATIGNILSKNSETREMIYMLPVDNREHNKKLLGDLRNNVDLHMNPSMAEMGLNTGYPLLGASSTALSMDSMAEFVNSRLADDLSLI